MQRSAFEMMQKQTLQTVFVEYAVTVNLEECRLESNFIINLHSYKIKC